MSVTAAPPPPPTPTPPTEECPLCGAPLGAEQEWCLRCGGAARTRLAAIPNWRAPVIALSAVVVLSLGALTAALVSLAGSSKTSGATGAATLIVTTPAAGAATSTGTGSAAGAPATTAPTTTGAATVPGATTTREGENPGNDTGSCHGNQHTGDDDPRGKHHPHDTRGGGTPTTNTPGAKQPGTGATTTGTTGTGSGAGTSTGTGPSSKEKGAAALRKVLQEAAGHRGTATGAPAG